MGGKGEGSGGKGGGKWRMSTPLSTPSILLRPSTPTFDYLPLQITHSF